MISVRAFLTVTLGFIALSYDSFGPEEQSFDFNDTLLNKRLFRSTCLALRVQGLSKGLSILKV